MRLLSLLLVVSGMSFARTAPAAKPRVAFFGSSTAAGVGAASERTRFSSLLATQLGWTEVNLGLSGSALSRAQPRETTPSAVERIDELLATKPDVVVLMYGANDAKNHVPLDAFRRDLAECLKRLSGVTVIVLAPQPSQMLVALRGPYDAALREGARAAGVPFIDTNTAFPSSELAALSADGLHLNDRGHARLAKFLAPLLEGALRAAPAK